MRTYLREEIEYISLRQTTLCTASPGWTRDQMFHEKITLPGGGKGYVQYETSEKIDDRWPNRVAEGTLRLKLVGEIGYRDDNGVERWVGFLRQYDWEFRRFRIMDDPDHEYQD